MSKQHLFFVSYLFLLYIGIPYMPKYRVGGLGLLRLLVMGTIPLVFWMRLMTLLSIIKGKPNLSLLTSCEK